MLFESPITLARAFESGEATLLRWQKTLRHAAMHHYEPSAIKAALVNPSHLAIAEQG